MCIACDTYSKERQKLIALVCERESIVSLTKHGNNGFSVYCVKKPSHLSSDICGLDAYEHMFSLDTSEVIRMFNDTQSEVFNKIILNLDKVGD